MPVKTSIGDNFPRNTKDFPEMITMRPERITQIIRKQFFCVTDVRAIGKLFPENSFCVIGVYRKYHMEAPKLHKKIPARKLCVTDVLCN